MLVKNEAFCNRLGKKKWRPRIIRKIFQTVRAGLVCKLYFPHLKRILRNHFFFSFVCEIVACYYLTRWVFHGQLAALASIRTPFRSVYCCLNWCQSSNKIKYLHLIEQKVVSPSQDRLLVFYSIRNMVGHAKVCVRAVIFACLACNVNVFPFTKCWTETEVCVNCAWLVFYHSLKWFQSFVIAQWKDEGFSRAAVSNRRSSV